MKVDRERVEAARTVHQDIADALATHLENVPTSRDLGPAVSQVQTLVERLGSAGMHQLLVHEHVAAALEEILTDVDRTDQEAAEDFRRTQPR